MPRLPNILGTAVAAATAIGGAAFALLRRRPSSAPDTAEPAPAAADAAAAAAPAPPPPVETPGPSVTPPAEPASDAERAEEADATTPDIDLLEDRAGGPVDDLVEAETAAAAAEAAGIGGPLPAGEEDLDPSLRPVYEAGGGEQDGFELAEEDLIDNATHGGGRGNPLRDAPTAEVESDLSTAEYGEADEEAKDPEGPEDDAEQGEGAEK